MDSELNNNIKETLSAKNETYGNNKKDQSNAKNDKSKKGKIK
jgi:hypothetical protein